MFQSNKLGFVGKAVLNVLVMRTLQLWHDNKNIGRVSVRKDFIDLYQSNTFEYYAEGTDAILSFCVLYVIADRKAQQECQHHSALAIL